MIIYTMGRASFITPIFFFSSIRAGSGKASIVANLSVYLNNLSQKIAIIDLDSETPLKLKNSFPQSIALQEYADINLLARTEDSRYQKNFYFTETSLISYFPAHQLKDPALLFSDTTLRDFFIQLKASFDVVMVNFPAGPLLCIQASELLSRAHLWRGSKPVSIIVSQADEKSLVILDTLLQKNPALSYQIQENTMLLFNRVPSSPEDQNLSDSTLNSYELRRLFDLPLSYIIPINEEFPLQRLHAGPLVLKPDSLLHQAISSLNRLLSHAGENPLKEISPRNTDFQACLDGELLEKLTPYLEKIQIAAAARLFIHPSELQVFLEEGSGNFRLRIRLAGVTQPLLGINTKLTLEPECRMVFRQSPGQFKPPAEQPCAGRLAPVDRGSISTLVFKSVFKFDDYFLCNPEAKLHRQIDMLPEKPRCPSPILFKPSQTIPEIPSLSHILGYTRQTYKKLGLSFDQELCKISGVTHFFIPPEFALHDTDNNCIFPVFYKVSQNLVKRDAIKHSSKFAIANAWPEVRNAEAPDLPDAFARNKPFVMENNFLLRYKSDICQEFPVQTSLNIRFAPGTFIKTSPFKFNEIQKFKLRMQSALEKEILSLKLKSSPPPENKLASYLVDKTLTLPALASFSTHSGSWPGVYREYKKHFTHLQMVQSIYFTLTPMKAPEKPNVTGLHTVFSSARFASPAEFCQSGTITTDKEHFHHKESFKSPSRFTWEDLLLDYVYQSCKKIAGQKPVYSSQNKMAGEFKPEPNLHFELNFPDYDFSNIPPELRSQRNNLSQFFQTFSSDLKSLPLGIVVTAAKYAGEILYVKTEVKQERNYKDSAGSQAYRTDCITDSSFKLRNLAVTKSRMLQINTFRADDGTIARVSVAKINPTITDTDLCPRRETLILPYEELFQILQEVDFPPVAIEILANYQPAIETPPIQPMRHNIARKSLFKSAFSIIDIAVTSISAIPETLVPREPAKFKFMQKAVFPPVAIEILANYRPDIETLPAQPMRQNVVRKSFFKTVFAIIDHAVTDITARPEILLHQGLETFKIIQKAVFPPVAIEILASYRPGIKTLPDQPMRQTTARKSFFKAVFDIIDPTVTDVSAMGEVLLHRQLEKFEIVQKAVFPPVSIEIFANCQLAPETAPVESFRQIVIKRSLFRDTFALVDPNVTEVAARPEILLTRSPGVARIEKTAGFLPLAMQILTSYPPNPKAPPEKILRQTIARKSLEQPTFNLVDIELSTLTMRQEYRKFHNFTGKDICTRINLMPQTVKRSFKLQDLPVNFYTYKIVHDQIEIPAALPLRSKRSDVPTMEKLFSGKLGLQIERVMNSIVWQSGLLSETDTQKMVKVRNPEPSLRLPVRFPLATPAPMRHRRLQQRKINFFARFPDPMEVLYQHLLWTLSYERTSGFAICETSLKQRSEVNASEFLFPRRAIENRKIQYHEKPAIASSRSKIRQTPARELLAIANLSLRDLMNLARQTNLKFNEISNKIRA